jgi:hypothetical protein
VPGRGFGHRAPLAVHVPCISSTPVTQLKNSVTAPMLRRGTPPEQAGWRNNPLIWKWEYW